MNILTNLNYTQNNTASSLVTNNCNKDLKQISACDCHVTIHDTDEYEYNRHFCK